jgi:hypothetical protein
MTNDPVPPVGAADGMASPPVRDDLAVKVAGEHLKPARASSPTRWWLYGLVGLAVIIAVLFAMQLINGAPGTDVQPGTPSAAPVVEPAVPTP